MGADRGKAARVHRQSDPALEVVESGHRTSIYLVSASIFLSAFGIRLALMFMTRSYLDWENSELVLVATSLAQGHGFANAFGDTGPTAYVSPLYPFLLSLVYRWSSIGIHRAIAQEVLSCFFAAITWSLIPVLGEICRIDRRVGITAGMMGAVLTINRWAETKGSSEAAMAGLACLVLFMFYMRCWHLRDFSLRAGVLAGILSGVAMLVSASLGSIIVGLLIAGYVISHRFVAREYLRFAFVVVTLIFAALLPWAMRNYLVLGEFVWTRSNLPLELMVSNNDYASTTLNDNEVSGYKYHPLLSAEQRAAVRSMGELAYQRKMKSEALRWIASHPKQFGWLTLQRIYHFWFPAMKRQIQTVALAVLTVASLPALILLLKRKQLFAYGLLTILATYPLVYYVVQAHPRYVYPIQWIFYLLTSQCIVLVMELWEHKRWRASSLDEEVVA